MGLSKIDYEDVGIIDMDLEGVSYEEFLNGKKPQPIEKLICPMMDDQSTCHDIKGFTDKCNELNDGWLSIIPRCKNKENKKECWKRFKEAN